MKEYITAKHSECMSEIMLIRSTKIFKYTHIYLNKNPRVAKQSTANPAKSDNLIKKKEHKNNSYIC